MADIGLPTKIPWLPYETTQPKTEIVKPAPKIKSKLPEYIQNQADEIINQSKEKKEIELKVESVFEALENRYSNFDRTKFKIEISWLKKSEISYLWYWVFLLYAKKWELLSYIKDSWETLLDMTKFNPYKDSFEKSMMNHIWINIWKWKDWKWFLNDEYWTTKEWEEEFDRYIISKYVLKR